MKVIPQYHRVWDQFIPLDENKAELASVLTRRLIEQGDNLEELGWEIVCSGGEKNPMASAYGVLEELTSEQEEADTRLILHNQHAKQLQQVYCYMQRYRCASASNVSL
jgi:hypothetical protein